MIKALIIEDEPLAAQRLTDIINNLRSDIEIVEIIKSVKKSKEWLANKSVDLIFLDIHLSDGNCFEIFEEIKVSIPIIFTTAYDKYAIRAFKLYGIDYLLKPVSEEELRFALEKFDQLNKSQPNDYSKLIDEFRNSQKSFKQKFLVQVGNKLKSIPSESISYFFAAERNVYLVLSNGSKYIIDYTLDKIENIIDDTKFFRINRKLIISSSSINSMESYSRGRVILEINPKLPNGVEGIVSIERASEFKAWLDT
jgi:DNA-binding LytR/AlgR family response regulator